MVLALENVENKKEMVRCQRRAVLPCKVVWGAPSIHQKWWVNTQTKPHCCKEKHQQALYVVLSWNPKQCDFLSKKMHNFCIDEINNNQIDAKSRQMAFPSARCHCSWEFFGNPWSNKSDANAEDSDCTVRMLLFFSIRSVVSNTHQTIGQLCNLHLIHKMISKLKLPYQLSAISVAVQNLLLYVLWVMSF